MIKELGTLYDRDLAKLQKEIDSFTEDANLWRITGDVKNSAGNLCVHLVGNLKMYIGNNLGSIPYTRDRDAEFSTKGVAKQDLSRMVAEAKSAVSATLAKMEDGELEKTYPEQVLGYPMTTGFFLVHLVAHLAYHLGQINYLRRILDKP